MVGEKRGKKLNYSDEELIKKLNNDIKTRNRIYISATIITVLILLPFLPFWFNITNAMHTFGIGHYQTEKEYVKFYGNEIAGIHIELDITRIRLWDIDIISGEYAEEFGYMVNTSISMINSEIIQALGFSYRLQIHRRDEKGIEYVIDTYDPPRDTVQHDTGYAMEKYAVCNSTGTVKYHFIMDSILYNETVQYFIDYIIPFNNLDYANFNLLFYSILGLYLLSIGLVPFIFFKIIKPIFGFEFDKDDLEREKRFREFVDKRKGRQRHNY